LVDPLSEVIALLQPGSVLSKGISGAGRWAVRYAAFGQPSFCAVLEGSCLLAVDGEEPATLRTGDFVLLPATPGFTLSCAVLSGTAPPTPRLLDPAVEAGRTEEVRHGRQDGPPDVRLLGGYFVFGSPDAGLLVSLLPQLIHVRDEPRLATLVQMVDGEAQQQRAGRERVLSGLVELLLIETLRSTHGAGASPGLLRGLADARLAQAIRQMHAHPEQPWTVEQLGREAALSRSAFFERFTRAVGMPPMEYLMSWRMALARSLLRAGKRGIAEVAERVGYGSASTFSTAFSRHVGVAPGRYARGD